MKTEYHILNLGAGVQSTTLFLRVIAEPLPPSLNPAYDTAFHWLSLFMWGFAITVILAGVCIGTRNAIGGLLIVGLGFFLGYVAMNLQLFHQFWVASSARRFEIRVAHQPNFDMTDIERPLAIEHSGHPAASFDLAPDRIVAIVPFVGTLHRERFLSPMNDAMAFGNGCRAVSDIRNVELSRHKCVTDEIIDGRFISHIKTWGHDEIAHDEFWSELQQKGLPRRLADLFCNGCLLIDRAPLLPSQETVEESDEQQALLDVRRGNERFIFGACLLGGSFFLLGYGVKRLDQSRVQGVLIILISAVGWQCGGSLMFFGRWI